MIRCRALLLAIGLGALAASAGRGEPAIIRAEPGTLEHYLAGRLLVTTPDDTAFLEEVAAAVRSGDLPESLVRGTCEWAAVRASRQRVRYPFPSFRKALEIKAKRLGVEL
jgi:hypothetical protein